MDYFGNGDSYAHMYKFFKKKKKCNSLFVWYVWMLGLPDMDIGHSILEDQPRLHKMDA